MRELRTDGVVKLILVPTEDMTADLLTKPLHAIPFAKLRRLIMNLIVRLATSLPVRRKRRSQP